ncbi:hypothetical protein ACFX13_009157 [Malus domestica]
MARKLANPNGSMGIVVEKLGAKRFFERGDDNLGSCSVCLEELSGGIASELIRMPCSHVYHPSCIPRWFNTDKKTCPNCRYQLHVDVAAALSNKSLQFINSLVFVDSLFVRISVDMCNLLCKSFLQNVVEIAILTIYILCLV